MYKRLPKKIIPTVALGEVLDKTAALHKQEKTRKIQQACTCPATGTKHRVIPTQNTTLSARNKPADGDKH